MSVQIWVERQSETNEQSGSTHATVDFAQVVESRYNKRFAHQRTLSKAISFSGIGLHSGMMVNVKLLPAPSDHGIVYIRTDLPAGDKGTANRIPARFDKVVNTMLCTKIGLDDRVSVGTIEHFMAAVRSLEIDNLIIEIDGPEMPIMDGSSVAFLEVLNQAQIVEQERARQVIKVLKPIEVFDKGRQARLSAADTFEIDFKICFDNPVIGTQTGQYKISPQSFAEELADCRTFGFFEDVEKLQAMGLARGGSLENAVVIKDGEVANPDGLRRDDEFVRHKALDAVGDLYLAGLQVQGLYEGDCAGHEMNNLLLKALFADPTAWVLTHQSIASDSNVNTNTNSASRSSVRVA